MTTWTDFFFWIFFYDQQHKLKGSVYNIIVNRQTYNKQQQQTGKHKEEDHDERGEIK